MRIHCSTKNAKIKTSEAHVLKSICMYLKLRGYFFWRAPNVGVYDQKRRVFRTPQFVMKGVPDIFCMAFPNAPVWFAIECKSTIGRQSPDQKYFQQQFEKYTGVYLLARGIEDVQKAGL